MLKKAIELSVLCEQHIYFVIYDSKKKKMVEYSSDPNFDDTKISAMKNDSGFDNLHTHEKYKNDDLNIL